jgi:N-acetylglucosamine repressor
MTFRTQLRGNRDVFKAINRNLVLNVIRREASLSRTQLAESVGLSTGAVSQIISELIEDKWVLESGEGDYTGGRRQMLLRLNPRAGYALGVKLMEGRVVCAVTNFESQVLHYEECGLDGATDPTPLSATLAQIINVVIENAHVPREQFFGIGLGLAGVIYPNAGVVHYSPFFGWRDVPLAELLQTRLNLPVYVENDVNTLTLSEHLFGAGRHQSNFVVVTVGRGIGMGIVINGQLHQGSRGGAGELGHIMMDLPRARQTTPEEGSLETLAADPGVIRAAQKVGLVSVTRLSDIVAAADAGNQDARDILAQSGEHLGVALASVVNILCPNVIIVSGEGVAVGDYRLKPMMEALKRYTFNGLLEDVEVIIEPTDDRAWARGAASLVMSKVFESPRVETQIRA